MAKNGNKAPQPKLTPSGRIQLDQPEQVGTISVAEAAEIRERNRLLDAQQDLLKAKQSEVNDVAKLVTLLRMESLSYVQRLCQDRGLSLGDDYNVQSETGIIWRTAMSLPEERVEETVLVEAAPAKDD